MTLYLVVYQDEDGDIRDAFVSAASPLEAFVVWRQDQFEGEPWPGHGQQFVEVYAAPQVAEETQVHVWDHGTKAIYELDLDLLATRAIAAGLTVPVA